MCDITLPPTGDLAANPGMCSAQELNWWLFSSQAGARSTEPYQPGLRVTFSIKNIENLKEMLLIQVYLYLCINIIYMCTCKLKKLNV